MSYKKSIETKIISRNKGYVFPMILLATLSVGLFVLTLSRFQAMNKAQFSHLNEYQRAFNIASSVLVEVLANLQEKQWEQREFKGSPIGKTAELFGGEYNLLVEDFDASQYLFDTKIRILYASKYYLFYWRLKYIPNLLDFTSFAIPIYFGQFDNKTGTMSDFEPAKAKVAEVMQKKSENLEKATDIGRIVDTKTTTKEALKVLGIVKPDIKDASRSRTPKEQIRNNPTNVKVTPIDEVISSAIANAPSEMDGYIAFTPPQPGTTVHTNISGLRVRSEPWGTIVGKFPDNSSISIIGELGDWYALVVNGKRVFVHQNYVSIPGRPGSGVAPTPPSP